MSDIPQTDPRFRRAQWRTLGAVMFCYFFYYTGRQTFGFAIPGLEAELGLTRFLHKPFSARQMVDVVQEALTSART